MIINHKSHFSWWHEGAHMTVAARWGFKYYLMNQNTWSRPVLWNAAASTLVLSIFCCAEVAAAAGTPCLSASCEDESLTCLHICTVSQTSNHKGWKKWDPSNQLWVLWLIGRKFFPVCVCVCGGNVAECVKRQWMIDRTQQVYYQGVFGLRLTFGLASSLTDSNNSCQKVWNCLFSGWHLNVTVAVSSYKRKPNAD